MFNERAGGLVQDMSGKDYHSTLNNGPLWKANALQFDGVDDFCGVITPNIYASNNEGTILVWLKPFGGAETPLVSYWAYNQGVFMFNWYPSLIYVQFWEGGTSDFVHTSVSISANTWGCAALTSNGSAYKIYMNGISQPLTVYQGSNSGRWFSDLSPNTRYLFFGRWWASGYDWKLNGQLSEVRVYDRPLSDMEIYSQVTDRISGKYAEFPRLNIAYFYAPAAGISMPSVMLQHDHFDGGAIL